MKKLFVFLFFVLLCSSLFAYTNNALIYAFRDSIYSDMDNLYSEAGLVRPSGNRPWSEAEAVKMLGQVERESLSEYGRKLYDRIEEKLDSGLKWNYGEDFSLNVGLVTSMEGYFHTNDESFITEYDWERSYDERKSFLRLYLETGANDNFYATTDVHFRHNRVDRLDEFTAYSDSGRLSNDNYIGSYKIDGDNKFVKRSYFFSQNAQTNVFFDTRHFSFIWPRRAVFSFGGKDWNFSLNRDYLSLGNAYFGNLLVDDHTFSDYSKLTFFSNHFKFDSILIFLNTAVNGGENMDDEARIYLIHTFQFRILDRVSLTISENVMYRYKTFNILYLNPSYIYHNYNNRSMFNAFLYLDMNILIIKNLEFYGQFGMDQARAPNENDWQSDSMGFVTGLSYTHPIADGTLKVYAEYTKTMPLLYRRDKVDFIRVYRYNAVDSSDAYFVDYFDYIGFPYGGDCRMLELKGEYTSIENWNATVFSRFVQKEEVNIFKSHNNNGENDSWANLSGDTPYGDRVKYFMVLGIKAEASLESLFSWPDVSFNVELDWVGRFNYTKSTKSVSSKESDLQFTIGVTLEI